jgi:hypothetical protein
VVDATATTMSLFFRFYAALEGFFTGLKRRARGALPTRRSTTTADAFHYCEISSTRSNESILQEMHGKKTALDVQKLGQ